MTPRTLYILLLCLLAACSGSGSDDASGMVDAGVEVFILPMPIENQPETAEPEEMSFSAPLQSVNRVEVTAAAGTVVRSMLVGEGSKVAVGQDVAVVLLPPDSLGVRHEHTIASNVSGVVTSRAYDDSDTVRADARVILVVEQVRPLLLTLDVPAPVADRLHPTDSVTLTVETYGRTTFPATVRTISVGAADTLRRVVITIPNKSEKLLPGMPSTVILQTK